MTQLLRLYQSEVDTHINAVREIFRSLLTSMERQNEFKANAATEYIPPPASGPKSRAQLLNSAKSHISQARELFASMSSEISSLPYGEERQKYETSLHQYEKEADNITNTIHSSFQARVATADREDLLLFRNSTATGGGGGVGGGEKSWINENVARERVDHSVEAQRRAALQVTSTLQGGTSHLEKAESLLHRANTTAHETLQTLRGQTEQIRHLGDATEEVDVEISESLTVIHRMRRTALKHKVYLLLLMGLLALVIVVYIITIFR